MMDMQIYVKAHFMSFPFSFDADMIFCYIIAHS